MCCRDVPSMSPARILATSTRSARSGVRLRVRESHKWQSTPTRYQWSEALGCPFPSGMGEGNNSPVGAGGATRLTGLNPGARLTPSHGASQLWCGNRLQPHPTAPPA